MQSKHSEESSEDESDSESVDENTDESSNEPTVDVWNVIKSEAAADGENILEQYKRNVIFCRSMDDDTIHKEVMRTLEKAQEDEEMDFQEALDYAVDKRKFLIFRELGKFHEEEDELSAAVPLIPDVKKHGAPSV